MEQKPLVTIGIPVYNGAKTIRTTLDSVVAQTFRDFVAVISDNASDDSTPDICKEYAKLDDRIKYHRQKKNIGLFENFYHLLNTAQTELFVWLAADDYWDKTFLEKNVNAVTSDYDLVGSIGQVSYYEKPNKKINKNRKIKRYFSYDEYPKHDDMAARVSFYLRLGNAEDMYALYRTKILQQCTGKNYTACDLAVILKALKFGRIKRLDETLLYRSGLGASSYRARYFSEWNDYGLLGLAVPYLPLTAWVWRNLGTKVFIKNLDYLMSKNLSAVISQIQWYLRRK